MPHRLRLVSDSSVGLEPLPADYATRWGALRKAQVVHAVEIGRLRLDEALDRYRLSLEEFRGWQKALHARGLRGLRVGQSGTRPLFGRKGERQAFAPRRPALRLV
jgi:hypothetical protein